MQTMETKAYVLSDFLQASPDFYGSSQNMYKHVRSELQFDGQFYLTDFDFDILILISIYLFLAENGTSNTIPMLAIRGPDPEPITSIHLDVRPTSTSSSALWQSQNKRFFPDRRDSFLRDSKELDVPRKSLSEQVLLHVKRSMSLDYSKVAGESESDKDAIHKMNRPQFDSTGMFWWCYPQSFDDLLMVGAGVGRHFSKRC